MRPGRRGKRLPLPNTNSFSRRSPSKTTHQRLTVEERAKLGIGDGMVRLSVGLEAADDLEADLAQALKAV